MLILPHANFQPLQAAKLLNSWEGALIALEDASLVTTADALHLPQSLAAQLRQAAHSLMQQRHEVLSGPAAKARAADRASQLRQLLQPAAHLAGLVQQYRALPTLESERQLAAARAAATRSCAYLRCANVAGEGGPAAGEGAGSMRCRWAGAAGEWGLPCV